MKPFNLFISFFIFFSINNLAWGDTSRKVVDESKEVDLDLLGTNDNPVKVGLAQKKEYLKIIPQENVKIVDGGNGPLAEEIYFWLLRDPLGQPYKYERLGSTGSRVNENGELHVLDTYELTSSTGEKRKIVIDMYHPEKHPCDQPAPKGMDKISCQSILNKHSIDGSDFKEKNSLKGQPPLSIKDKILDLEMRIQQGYPAFEYEMGALYSNGNGVKKDLQKGLEYFLSSAEKGFKPAMLTVGHIYSLYCKPTSSYDEQKCNLAKKYLSILKDEYMSAGEILEKIISEEKSR